MERKLKAERRVGAGKGVARKIRAAGRVPAVAYGHGAEPMHLTVDSRELFHLLHTDAGMNVLVDLRVDGENFLAMPREVQRDHLRGTFLHIDFIRIARNEKIAVEVPIHLTGESHGVKEGGVVEHHLWTLHVECLPQDVPSAIEVDIAKLGINESLKVAELSVRGNLTVLTAPEETIVSIVPPQVLKLAEEVPEELAEAEAAEGEAPTPEGAEAGQAPTEEASRSEG
jgi:large subunit ribosomal protein L25